MTSHLGIYKLDEGWLSWRGEWRMSPRIIWWNFETYTKDYITDNIFDILLQETKDILIELVHNDDVKGIWLVPFDNKDQISWLEAIRLS